MGLMLPSRRLLARGAPWWRRPEHLLDGVAPGLFVDVLNRRHALAGAAVPLASVLTVTAASGKTYWDGAILRTAAANEARIDWSGGAAELLLEGPATNLCPVSADFTAAAWVKSGFTASPATLSNGIGGTAFSGMPNLVLYDQTGATFFTAEIPRPAPSALTKRASYTFTTPAGCTAIRFYALRNGGSAYAYILASVTASTTYTASWFEEAGVLGGVQIEAGAVATSYIPTTGAAATRATDLCQLTAGAAAAIQGVSAAVAWRGTIPVALAGQLIVGLGDAAHSIRATNAPTSRIGLFGDTVATSPGNDVIPGAVGICAGWGTSGSRLGVNGTASTAAETNVWASTIYLGPSTGIATGQTLRLRQLVGWTLTDRPSTAAAIAQARLAA
ncbi:hypothetical protein [Prosthecodimorpha staleyi]|uniref:Uncharacterized protein n=1 Tax=Prosthecodimorpha staleyi TaxID=2840188 RepID=A0A947GE42_9HYPH|nr:hypothetical protein [Prosthecodimorpha staleyi]MBT9293298.1 hypothetical protein [Prosthecodimorpha staleyi]